ncbi:sialidase family protein, partial [Brachyspira catarrhinii]|uniref:sialidase family protein n=1 Tax=Brachyspira catarrhinii TaxID=2528966 RepID=UPI001387258F
RSSDDGKNWIQKESIDKPADAKNSFVTYGQGVTLRHGANANSQKLIFPYFYSNNNSKRFTAIMYSDNDGNTFSSVCNSFKMPTKEVSGDLGVFSTFETKLIELSDGSILYNTAYYEGGVSIWAKSTNCGKYWTFTVLGTDKEDPGAKHIDFSRYEYNG